MIEKYGYPKPDEETSIQHRYLSHTANVIKLLGFYKHITYSKPVPLVRRGIRAQIQSHCSNRQSNRRGYSCGSIPCSFVYSRGLITAPCLHIFPIESTALANGDSLAICQYEVDIIVILGNLLEHGFIATAFCYRLP